MRRVLAIVTATAVLGPAAQADTGLINVVTQSPLKAQKRIGYQASCTAKCSLTATLTLQLKGPDPAPVVVGPTDFPVGSVAVPYVQINRATLRELRESIHKARLRTTTQAVNLDTGATDTVDRVFRFQK